MAGCGQVVALPVGGPAHARRCSSWPRRTAAYDDDDIGFLDAVAEHAAQALRRAVLVDLLREPRTAASA
jgi:GAF domain-containing protein